MTKRLACPPAPGPLEDYAAQFDALFGSLAQRRGLRDYLQGLLLPRDRNKTLTALAGAEPVLGAQHAAVQGLQFFLSESAWDHERVNQRRLELLLGDPATRPHEGGVLVIDDTGDRKDGRHTAHVARQYLGSVGKTDNGIVAVTSLWADERVYWPAHVVPYTPAPQLPKGRRDAAFGTKPQLAAELVGAARQAGIGFRAVVADCFYGDNPGFIEALGQAGVAWVLAVKPRKGVWAPADQAHTPHEAAHGLAWQSPEEPGDWTPVVRGSATGTPRPGGRPTPRCPRPAGAPTSASGSWRPPPTRPGCPSAPPGIWPPTCPAPPAAPAGAHGKGCRPPTWPSWCACTACATGWSTATSSSKASWAGPTSRSVLTAIRRHWQLVCCAFSFCWQAWFTEHPAQPVPVDPATVAPAGAQRGETTRPPNQLGNDDRLLAERASPSAGVASPVEHAAALLASVVASAPAGPAATAA